MAGRSNLPVLRPGPPHFAVFKRGISQTRKNRPADISAHRVAAMSAQLLLKNLVKRGREQNVGQVADLERNKKSGSMSQFPLQSAIRKSEGKKRKSAAKSALFVFMGYPNPGGLAPTQRPNKNRPTKTAGCSQGHPAGREEFYLKVTLLRSSSSRCAPESSIESNAGPASGLDLSMSVRAAFTLSSPSAFAAM